MRVHGLKDVMHDIREWEGVDIRLSEAMDEEVEFLKLYSEFYLDSMPGDEKVDDLKEKVLNYVQHCAFRPDKRFDEITEPSVFGVFADRPFHGEFVTTITVEGKDASVESLGAVANEKYDFYIIILPETREKVIHVRNVH